MHEKIAFCGYILEVIKSKVLVKKYLQNFISLLNVTLNKLTELMEFDIKVIVLELKGKLSFKFIVNDEETNLSNLSSGEKARVSLIVLFSMLETLQTLVGIKFNILALDEILGVLDKSGVEVLKKLLTHYKTKYTIFLIQHHEEIPKEFFDDTLELHKVNGITHLKE